MRFDHLGVLARTLAGGRDMLAAAYGVADWTFPFEDHGIGVDVQFGRCAAGLCYEVIAPRPGASPVRRALEAGINTFNHVAFLVDNLEAEAARLYDCGFVAVNTASPAVAFGGSPIQFFLNREGLLTELIEAPAHRHRYDFPLPTLRGDVHHA